MLTKSFIYGSGIREIEVGKKYYLGELTGEEMTEEEIEEALESGCIADDETDSVIEFLVLDNWKINNDDLSLYCVVTDIY